MYDELDKMHTEILGNSNEEIDVLNKGTEITHDELSAIHETADKIHRDDIRGSLVDLTATIRRWVRGNVLKIVESHSEHFIRFCYRVENIKENNVNFDDKAAELFEVEVDNNEHEYVLDLYDSDSTLTLCIIYSPNEKTIYIYHVTYESEFMKIALYLKVPCYV